MSALLYVIWVLVFPRDVLGLTDIEECSLNLHLAVSTTKKPLGRINDVLILANRNYVPIDVNVPDIDCNPSRPIILGRPLLRTIGAIIDMKEGNIKFQFPLKKGMDLEPKITTLESINYA